MVKSRAGGGTLGAILTVVVIVALSYYSWEIGGTYWKFYQFRDRMQQEARFAGLRSDLVIKRRLRAVADSLALPKDAGKITVRRRVGSIQIWAEYYESIEFPGFVREVHFHPAAKVTF